MQLLEFFYKEENDHGKRDRLEIEEGNKPSAFNPFFRRKERRAENGYARGCDKSDGRRPYCVKSVVHGAAFAEPVNNFILR
jgi:hypothetical protein